MFPRSHETNTHFVRILLPEGDPLVLQSPPDTLEEMVELIAEKTEAAPQDIRLTFRDSQGARMMLVGEKRYTEALSVLKTRVLQMTVVLVPQSSSSDTQLFHSRSVSDISTLDIEGANQRPLSQEADFVRLDPKVELHRRVGSMLNNSMHYFSPKFKGLLFTLSTCEPVDITEIDLKEANVGQYECFLLSEIIELLPNLHSLDLESNNISSGGLSNLCSALQRHKSIRHLNLSHNALSPKALKTLAGAIRRLGELELVAVARNHFNREGIEELQDAAPAKCHIHHDSGCDFSTLMDRPATSSEATRPHKVPLIADMQQLEALRGQRPATAGTLSEPHSTDNPETQSTESTPLASPKNLLKGIIKELKREAPDPETLDQLFRIRNLTTGEELDLRDENDESFPHRFAGLVNRERFSEAIEAYYEQRRRMNHQLWEAAEFNNVQLCRALLDINKYKGYTAQVNSKGLNGWTALHVAASKGNVETCRLLLDARYSTDVNARTNTQRTPLHLAAMKGHEEVTEILLAAGAGVNIVDVDGCAAIHYAAGFNYSGVVRVLLGHNCDISLVNSINKTAYEMSCSQEMTQLFLNYQRSQGLDCFPSPAMPPIAPVLRESPSDTLPDVSSSQEVFPISDEVFYSDFKPVFLIGKGSFGEVYLVVRVSTQELFAMKLLKKEKVVKQKLTRYVMTERKILSSINHPFIVKLYYAFQTSDRLGMVLEYCPGGDLGYHLSREKRFPEERAKIYLCECLLALEALHNINIVYRDLKPDNIVIDSEGHALLTDFGLSKELSKGSVTQSFCGSVAYLAPEVLTRRGHDMMVDWYLLGVLLYEMLVGVPPFFSCVREELFQNIQYGKLKFPMHVSGPARHLIRGLLERDTEKRLGARGVAEIKQHQFFAGINWNAVYRRELRPPVLQPIRRKPDPNTTMETLLGRHRRMNQAEKLENWSFVAD